MKFRELSYPDAPKIHTTPPGPKSKAFLDYHFDKEGGVISYARGMPMALLRGKGATVEDVDGNIYIDFFGGAGVMGVGHSHPEVVSAVQEQVKDLTHALDFPTPARRKLVEVLHQVLPKEINRVSFGGPTGSDAVESAIKLARYNTKRYPIIAFEGGYHGMTAGALTLCSGASFKEDFLPLIPEVHFVPYAYCYRCQFGKEPDGCSFECAGYLDHVLEDPHSGVGKPAAVIIEPIQGEGGSIVPPPGYIARIREICDRHDVLMIADEIQSGLCRTGKMFSFEHDDIVPDIVTMSKALGGIGLPISGIGYKEKLDTWPPGKHIGTFRGNVCAYIAGATALNFMVEEDLAGHVTRVGKIMLDLLKQLQKDSGIIGDVRGKGLMLGVELVEDKDTKKPAPALAKKLRTLCHQNGLLIEVGGHFYNVARFLPPLVLTEDLAKKGVEVFADAVREVEKTR